MRVFLTLGLIFINHTIFAQAGYKLNFTVKGWKDTTVYLGYYYGESTRVRDTVKVNHRGEFHFQKKEPLPQGVYFIVMNKSKMFDFVVGQDQDFRLETSGDDLIKNMKVSGDEDNKLYFENLLFLSARNDEADPYIKIIKDTTLKDDTKKKVARESFDKVNDKVMKYQQVIISKYPTTLTARIFKITVPIAIPGPPKKANGTIDSSFQLRYYRTHFFDNFDLSDDAMLRLQKDFYREKIKEYLDKLFVPHPDTITKAIDGLVAKAQKNPETYKYMVYSCAYMYVEPSIMGLDQVFVNLYNRYFATGEMDYWAAGAVKKNLKDLADKISRAQIGTTGPNLILQDVNLKMQSLYDIKKKYTIIYFFDPDCGHCKEESPKLVEFYSTNKNKYDLEVFAVSIDTSLQKLRNYIKEMKMTWITVDGPRTYQKELYNKLYYADRWPTVYVLDDQKKVIARKLAVEKLDLFFTNYEKYLALHH